MLVKLFNRILETATPHEHRLNDRLYVSGSVSPVKDPLPDPLHVENLSSLVTYINELQELDTKDLVFLLVEGPTRVAVLTDIVGSFEQRKRYLIAENHNPWDSANRYMTPEQFIIMIQSQFLQDDETTALLRLVGNIEDSAVKQFNDDGVTQQVTVKNGVVRRADVPAPSRVHLTPFRTFSEVPQVQSQFILRMQSGKGDGAPPQIALFEADGGAWRNKAMQNIKAYLHEALPNDVVLA